MADPRQRYHVIKKLDTGGMAEIYLGEMHAVEGFKKRVVIKRVLPRLTRNARFVQMFLDEARLSLGLVHANIVQVFDVGRADDTYFIVMEFVDGINLRSMLESLKRQNRQMPIELAIFITVETLKGLAYAHVKADPETGRPLGIVHRDISPPNTLISRQGEVKLVDFGLAKAAGQVQETDPGVVKGKFSYLAPEAAQGQEVDARSDLYGVAIVLFELLTGRRLFLGETDMQTLEQVRQARVPPLGAMRPEVTPDLEQILLRALAREAGDRYQDAHEFADALTRYLFAHSLHVTSRDLAQLVQRCLEESAGKGAGKDPRGGSVMEALIQQEILRFTSIEGEGGEPAQSPAAAPPVHDPGPESGADLIDTRTWLSDLAPTGSHPVMKDPAPARPKAAPPPPPSRPAPPPAPPAAAMARPAAPPPPAPVAAPARVGGGDRAAPSQARRAGRSAVLYGVLVVIALALGVATAALVHLSRR
jgi:eukaryotic-like serine/threonine-protein kinase